MFILKYQQSVYDSQIAKLEGHLERLQTVRNELEKLRGQMFNFWNDDRAQEAAYMLQNTMYRIDNEMKRATKLLTTYKSTTTYVSEADSAIGELAEEASSALNALGGLI